MGNARNLVAAKSEPSRFTKSRISDRAGRGPASQSAQQKSRRYHLSHARTDAGPDLAEWITCRSQSNNSRHARGQCQTHRTIGSFGVDRPSFAAGVLAMAGDGSVRHHMVIVLDNRTAERACQRTCHDRKDHKQGHPPGLPAQFAHMQHGGGRRYKVKGRRHSPSRFRVQRALPDT